MKKAITRHCAIFNCDRRRASTCCADCGYKNHCKNHCLNSPERCKCVKEEANHEVQH